jgi:hypothetical protein
MRVRFKQRFLIQTPSSWCQVALTVLSESGLINLQMLQTAAPTSKVLAVLTCERKYETRKQESTKQSMMICT